MLTHVALGMTAATTFLALPFLIDPAPLLGFVFGRDFTASAPIMRILCIGVIINGFFGANATLLNMSGAERRVTRASFISMIVLCTLLPILIRISDGIGAALSVMTAMTVWNVLLWWDARRLLLLNTCVIEIFSRRGNEN
jgi:O-antigen/teichoic acid export membrane protein